MAYSEDPLFVCIIILSIQTPYLVVPVMATYFAQTKAKTICYLKAKLVRLMKSYDQQLLDYSFSMLLVK